MPEKFLINDNMVIDPAPVEEMDSVEILRGPNIKTIPKLIRSQILSRRLVHSRSGLSFKLERAISIAPTEKVNPSLK